MLEVEWRRETRRVLLPILVLAPSPESDLTAVEAKALIDTGSTISGIARDVATRLSLSGRGKRPLVSAQGLGQVERYLCRIGLRPTLGPSSSFPFIFEEVMGFEFTDGVHFDALLGMDVLGQCDFSMDRFGACRLRFG